MAKFHTKIILEKRTPLKNGKYPVKLRLTIDASVRYYGMDTVLTEKEFKEVFNPDTSSRKNKKIRSYLIDEEERAVTLLEAMKYPNFQQFKALFTMRGTSGNIEKYYEMKIAECLEEERFGTADNYRFAFKSLKIQKDNLNFRDITPTWLKTYTNTMKAKGKSVNTISMYLRTLRTVFRKAISDGIINPNSYPFREFTIPASEKNKRPLERSEIELIANYSGNPVNEMYRDFFILSYCFVGLNPQDLLSIRWSDIDGNTLKIVRKKTVNTNSIETAIQLFINKKARTLIQKHGNPNNDYVFNVFDKNDKPGTRRRKIRNHNRAVNQALKTIAQKVGINKNVSVMHARHSAASHAIANNASIVDVSQALGHRNIKTTSDYLSSLDSGKSLLAETLEI